MSRSAVPGTREKTYHHGQLREALLNAAHEILDAQGAAALSLREIARHAGVSHAAPYHHFPDKQHLLQAVAERCLVQFNEAQEAAAAGQPTAAQAILAIGEAYVAYAAARPHAFQLIFDPATCTPGQPSPLTPIIEHSHDQLRALVIRAIQEGGLPDRPVPDLTDALWATVHGLADLVILGHLPASRTPALLAALLPRP